MSYKDLIQGRGGDHAGPSAPSGPQEARFIEGQVFKLASSVGQLKKLIDSLGTPKDTVDHRHRIAEANGSIQQLAGNIKDRIKALHATEAAAAGGGSAEQKQKGKKLLQDFANILQDYKGTQRIAQDREAATLPRPNPAPKPSPGAMAAAAAGPDLEQGGGGGGGTRAEEQAAERQALLQQQQRRDQALDNAITFNQSLIDERDQGIQDIARQIGEVNEMFQDLAVLINDQGVQVQTIDEHISATAERVKEGGRELVKAERSQASQRNKCLCLWLVAAVIVSIVIILVAL